MIHSVSLRNELGVLLLRIKGWITKLIAKIKKASGIFQMSNGKKVLRNSKSLNGTGALVMWIMVSFMCGGLI